MSFAESLFSDEERTIARGEELLSAGQAMLPASEYLDLLDSYRKLYRQSSRLVKMGDRIQGQLNRLNEQLVVSEEKYRSIFEGSIQGIYRSTPEGRFRVLNPAMARIFGFDSCQEMLRQVEDIGRDIYLSQVQRREFLLTLRARGMVKNHPLQLRRRDGALIWVECSTRGYFDDAGNIVEMEGMVQDVTEKRSMLQELENLARRDGLTGLWNRRYFMELGRREMSRVDRERAPLSLVYFDVDHFKSINDSHGHETGDKVLQEIAELGQGMLRKNDIFGRMGGEEFAILLPGATWKGALNVAEKMRSLFENNTLSMPRAMVRFTASFGVAGICPGCPCLEYLIKVADNAMYEAKRTGRNKVVCITAENGC